MKNLLVLFLSAILVASWVQTAPADSSKEKAAEATARIWLSLVDQGKYAESWTEAASYFKAAVTEENWKQMMRSVRQPLGTIKSRKLTSSKYARTLPGAPDGEYVVMQYKTSFENKQSAVETVTSMLDKDGKWRVSGYYLK
jgi:hypothetical protein